VPDDLMLRDELRRMLEAASGDGVLDGSPTTFDSGDAAAETIAGRLGRALEDRYVLEAEIGRGGMGAIFRAHEKKHQRGVILKVLRPDVAVSVGRQRFASEVRIAAQLVHPHIVPLLDSGEADGLLYFVMPRIPGETLRERLRRTSQLDPTDAMRLLRDIADALMHAHAAGVVHRDLKPENVLCSGDHAFLLDFGIAQWTDLADEERITGIGLAVGTPRYMAPEQAAGRAVDHRADIYAWGIVASEMLLGNRASELDIATARSDVPSALSTLIYRSLAVDPEHRPRSAGTLVAALDSIMSGGSPTPGSVEAVPPQRSRWGTAGALAFAAVVGTGVWLTARPSAVIEGSGLRMPIAVAPFRVESMDSSHAIRGRFAGAWITQGLHETGLFRVVPWSSVLQASEGAADPVSALRDQAGAGTVVTGSFFDDGESLVLQAEVRDTRRGALLAALAPVTVPRDSVALAIRQVRDRVMGGLATRRDPRFSSVAAILERPPTFEAYRAFERALGQFNAQRYRSSIEGFSTAFALDSGFISPVVYAAQAAWNTTQFPLLDSLLAVLDTRRTELSDYHNAVRVFLRAVYAGDAAVAYESASRAAAIAPESRAAFDAAVVPFWLGRPEEARLRFRALDPDRGAMLGWPSYWTNHAHALHLTGERDEEIRATREMRRRHPTTRVAWTLQARALAAHGDTAVLDSLLAAADTLEPHVYWSQGSMLVIAGEELTVHGDPRLGANYFARAERWLRSRLAEEPALAGHLFWLGTLLHHTERYAEASELHGRRAALAPDRAALLELAAISAVRAGDHTAVDRLAPPAPYDRAERAVALARLAAARGDAEAATSHMRAALQHGYRRWPWLHGLAWRDFLPLRGDTAFARLVGQPAR
jgi:tRNA A-37 threonylcarbamoyl transferase component Bud32/tetratricopeptide (TPR) repeat protein